MTERTDPRPAIRLKAVTAAVIGVLALVLVFQNTREGRIDVLFWTWTMPAWIWLLLIFLAGVLVGSIFPWLRPRRS